MCVSVPSAIQHAKRMSHFVLSYVACPALQYFTLSHKQRDFEEKKVAEHKLYVLILFTTFVCYVSHFNTLWTGDADLRLYITTLQDG
jgi:hypothetical protein